MSATPTPTPAVASVPATSSIECEEDEPCFQCETQGNRICGLTDSQRAAAWDLWDSLGGAEHLLVNPHSKVEAVGYSRVSPYTPEGPALATNQLALQGAEVWFIFTATHP